MDFNEYAVAAMVKQRHRELVADARRQAAARAAAAPRRPLRAVLGTALVRTGVWLLRDQPAAPGRERRALAR